LKQVAGDFLCFDLFTPSAKTEEIAQQIRERNIILDSRSSRKMGKIARLLGLWQESTTLKHIEEFVTALVSG
jgi:hypothetical protein